MRHAPLLLAAASVALSLAPFGDARAFTTPFHFHCRGNACGAVAFLDEGVGCTVATNYSARAVHVTQGPFYYDLGPGETHGELINGSMCAGYYDGGETATFE